MFGNMQAQTNAQVSDTEVAAHLRQVFNYMTGGVALSGLVAWFTASSPEMMAIAVKSQWIFLIAWFGFGFFMHKIIFKMTPTAALGTFIAFSALTGFCLSPIALVYTGSSIATAFFVTAIMFAGASFYGYTNPKSMAGMGRLLTMAGFGLFGAIILNLFIGSSGFSFWISLAVVPFIAIATAFEINQLKEQFHQFSGDEVLRSKMAVFGATSFYMNFVVMFLHILNLLGVMRDE
ncbi:MAG: FtsH-binding integral membrane protein [Alphaproteobacteria bacterium]|jgi:FtsH-binding integral membrane protein